MATTTITIGVDERVKKNEIPFRVAVPETSCYVETPRSFGLTGAAYYQHLLEAKERVLAGEYEEHQLLES